MWSSGDWCGGGFGRRTTIDEGQPTRVPLLEAPVVAEVGHCGIHTGGLRKKLVHAAVQEMYGTISGGSRVSTLADGRDMANVKGKERERENAPAVWIRECLQEDAVSI